LIEGLAPDGGCDLVADFARQYPTTIFMRLMGLPVEEADTFLGWIETLMHTSNADDPDGSKRMGAARTVYDYLDTLITDRRRAPRADLVSHMVASEVDGH